MSVPSPYAQRGPAASAESREDCRDYLRTGRCKYGASCKYAHPPNVQSGGGMKAPVDPSEPMFPVRPNEPMCQYYMKHGTCKFGQACKFHHPPQSSVTAALVGGGTVVMNVGRKSDVPQIVVNSLSGDGGTNGTPMMLQFLPQRPEEQDCIFFLKNGRCKYGATCRYHHPINFNQRRDDGRRQRVQVQQVPEGYLQHSNVQFIGQAGNHQINYQHQQQGHSAASNGNHMVVTSTDGPVTYMTVDGSAGKGAYHSVSVVNSDGYCAPTGAPMSHNQDHTSSTSSIASSYDTANSNMEHLVGHSDQQQQQSSGLWNRQKNNGSHASLNAYDSSNGRQQMGNRITSDGSIASRQRHRAASYGSASDAGGFVDATGSLGGRATSGGALPSNNPANSMPAWRNERTPSYDNVRRGIPNQYRTRGDVPSGGHHGEAHEQQQQAHGTSSAAAPSGGHGRRMPPPTGGRRRSTQAVDDGLSMMTSALLTMLDTPEEAAAEGYEFDHEDQYDQYVPGAHMLPTGAPMMGAPSHAMSGPMGTHMNGVPRGNTDGRGRVYSGDRGLDSNMFRGLPMNSPVAESQYQDPRTLTSEESSTWLPSWQGSKSVGQHFEGDGQTMSVMQPRHPGPSSPHNTSDVGLFLS